MNDMHLYLWHQQEKGYMGGSTYPKLKSAKDQSCRWKIIKLDDENCDGNGPWKVAIQHCDSDLYLSCQKQQGVIASCGFLEPAKYDHFTMGECEIFNMWKIPVTDGKPQSYCFQNSNSQYLVIHHASKSCAFKTCGKNRDKNGFPVNGRWEILDKSEADSYTMTMNDKIQETSYFFDKSNRNGHHFINDKIKKRLAKRIRKSGYKLGIPVKVCQGFETEYESINHMPTFDATSAESSAHCSQTLTPTHLNQGHCFKETFFDENDSIDHTLVNDAMQEASLSLQSHYNQQELVCQDATRSIVPFKASNKKWFRMGLPPIIRWDHSKTIDKSESMNHHVLTTDIDIAQNISGSSIIGLDILLHNTTSPLISPLSM